MLWRIKKCRALRNSLRQAMQVQSTASEKQTGLQQSQNN